MSNELEKDKEYLEPIPVHAVMAKLFAHLSKEVVERFGDEGREAIREGVRKFGEERGKGIAKRAELAGQTNEIENYLSNYDMGKSDHFECKSIYKENELELTYTKCLIGEQFLKDGMEEYGMIYCKNIDPALARGFNPDVEVKHNKFLIKDGICQFCFKMKDSIADK
ncbi:hypothetical protein Curi_c28150 [Gottschalkia acidurici 9a]|uniref:L-2-amino-thiazoline-4-carboxylic acid hydrolase n=1 Tax=Gottschalkia acidurici (strain ATCC 7906 / DSM 604 / BCRC 14475 / CIP 104303 / KCTC 5404 / NCIMB 10678 / 9a) TaxID=1128398 RepID=K0B1C6_GOTA9|nr:L-2-amino-thiazoline-4-carboxylic acid hydrolase [Gottschalkia acidurici]AFS79808.1 hypothetical protein Curi_c28150 [Gottschalkia acidurici 9a]